jgi:hypothetical protein
MEAIQNLLVALGISETQIKALNDETTPEQINEIADEFHKKQKEAIAKIVIQEKKPEFLIEATRKARKTFLTEIGVEEDEEMKSEKDLAIVVRKALEKHDETFKSSSTDNSAEVKKWQDEYKNSQKTIKEFEAKMLELQAQAEERYNNMVSDFYVNETIMKLPLKEGREFIIPANEVIDTFKGKAMLQGLKFKKGEKDIEVLDKDGNPIQKQNSGSRATEFHTLESYFDEATQAFIKRSNGNNNSGVTTPQVDKSKLSPEQLSQIAKAEARLAKMN